MITAITVTAPPGRLGLHVRDDKTEPNFNTIISQVTEDSPLAGTVFPGDRMVTLNGIFVQRFNSIEISNLFQEEYSKKKVIVVARKDGSDLQKYPKHHSSVHANDEGYHQRKEEHKPKHLIPHDNIGHGGQEAHRNSTAMNTGGLDSEQHLGQSCNSHSKLHKSYNTTIETGVYDTEAGMCELQHKEEPSKRWWKNKYLILILVAVGALLAIIGIVTGTLLQQRNQKSPNTDVSAVEKVGGPTSSEEDMHDVAKTFNGTSSSDSTHLPNNITSNEEIYDMDDDDDIEPTMTSSTENASPASQSITSFLNSSFMSTVPSTLLPISTPEALFPSTATYEKEAAFEVPITTAHTTTTASTTVYNTTTTATATATATTTTTTTTAKEGTITPSNVLLPTTESLSTLAAVSAIPNITSATTITTMTTASTKTSNALLVPTHDSGNDSCEKSIVLTEAVFARTGSIAHAAPTTELQTCDTTAQNLQGVWYSVVNSKRRIVRVQYLLKLPETNMFNLFLNGQGDAVLAMVKGSCSQCPESYRGGISNNSTDYSVFWDTPKLSAEFYSDYENYDGLRVYGVDFLNGIDLNLEENSGFLIIDEFLLEEDSQYLFYVGAEDIESGGSYEFNMTEFMAPPNEECDASLEVGMLPENYQGSLIGASSIFNLGYESDCNTNGRGVWYRLEGSGSTINIDLQIAKAGRNIGSVQWSIYSGSCDLLICRDSFPIDLTYENEEVSSHYERFMDIGEIYFLRFSGSSFYDAVNFNLTISQDEAPAHDECSGAEVISFTNDPLQTINGSTLGATPDINLCETKPDSKGVWYLFLGKGKLVSIKFTGSGWASLFQGFCNELNCMSKGDFFAENGTEYRILVEDYFSSDFELIVEQFESPENDSCDSALTIESLPFSYTGDMKGARTDDRGYYTGVWFTFTGTGTLVQVDLTDFKNVGYYYFALEVHTKDCSSIIAGAEDNRTYYSGTSFSEVIPTEIGLTYHLYVAISDTGYDKLPYYISIKS